MSERKSEISAKGRKRKKRRRRGLRIFLDILLFLAAAIVSLALVFQLKQVKVEGNVHNTKDEVLTLVRQCPTEDNTLLTALMNNGRTFPDEGFISSFKVSITSVSSVTVTVVEKRLVGALKDNGTYWYFDGDGIVQARSHALTDGDGIPVVEGLEPDGEMTMEEKLPVSGLKTKLTMLDSLRDRIDQGLEAPDSASFLEDGTLTLVYGDVSVKLGDGSHIGIRLAKLADILPILEQDNYAGTLHLENYDGSQRNIVFKKNEI
ncbi:MAG: hypothetical protein PUC99_09990 [Eubacteriales bacterium]|jgi:cell division protein FtsQ|nr:hypothetical protein [Lachnospiraceae bacterium]MDD5860648.1 hypothetical protein [Eubacteriales bacterium]MCH4064440.1 hypothetical protein [Lachnospiraceae bacterium]MCH4102835.1 hypothetical protein [Lachnospiraceae bacterium]MCI1308686.1 hypothetical protein [Lachnospiraceae bacterium]